MRDTKFRGFVEAESRWIYGDLLHNYWHLDGVVYETAIRYKINDGYSYPIPVKPDTVGQFTGLYDKDGREIYEGDVVRYTNPYSKQTYQHTVLWDNRFAGFALFENGNQWAKESDWLKIKDIEIVGNIHEHPKLLNEQQ
jgi:uncharacterized phage protein (TIGR01671 family)